MFWVVSVAAVFGLIFGSAINAMIWRIKVGRSWVRGRSVCPDCGRMLKAVDLVPVFSWVVLGGKCRYCHQPIKDHPLVEVTTALVFGLSAAVFYNSPEFNFVTGAFWLVMVVMLLVLAFYDLRWMILPDKVMLPLIVVAFCFAVALAVMTHSGVLLADHLGAAVLAGGAFYALVFFSKGRAMGGGDIKLAFAMGLILGIQSTMVALFVAFVTGAAVGVVLIASRRRTRKDQIPFGPFLALATIVAFLYGPAIVSFYLGLNGLN
jgi:leader peptidase (prepilin peptidase) / N-methyltransferase